MLKFYDFNLFSNFVNISQNLYANGISKYQNNKHLSKYFEDGLHSLKDLACVDSIRNYGLLGGIDISMRDKPGKAGFNVYKKCYDAGVNIKPTGDALIIAPPFVCEKKDIDEIINKMRKGISDHINS